MGKIGRRDFLKGTGGGLLSGFFDKFGIFPKEEPEPIVEEQIQEEDGRDYDPFQSSGSCALVHFGTGSGGQQFTHTDWGINPSRPRCHYCNAYIVRGRDTCPHCGGEYRERSGFVW